MPWPERSTMSLRQEFVLLASQEGANIRELCRRFQISPTTGYLWRERFAAAGVAGLADRSRRPHTSPTRSHPTQEAAVLAVRAAHSAWGTRTIAARLRARRTSRPGPQHGPCHPQTARAGARHCRPAAGHPALRAAGPECPVADGLQGSCPAAWGRALSSVHRPGRPLPVCRRAGRLCGRTGHHRAGGAHRPLWPLRVTRPHPL